MIKVENIKVYNIARAVYSARNALNSWDKSDSDLENDVLGEADLDLARRLFKAGADGNLAHRKFLRQAFVCMDITAPLYWISECDTYKVGTTRNSCSFMHKGLSKPFEISDFSTHFDKREDAIKETIWNDIIDVLNIMRTIYLKTKDDKVFQQIRCLLPSGYNQRFTITMTYENVFNIINQRQNHRLSEWRELCEILKDLPYVREIGGIEDE